jgi:TfdA family taurine catabolism dioxygenase TauD
MGRLRRWTFARSSGPARLQRELRRDGMVWCRAPDMISEVASSPYRVVTELFGERPARLEITRVIDRGQQRYIAGRAAANLHTDHHHGTFPPVQILFCMRQAKSGGESILVDTWQLASALARRDRALYAALFETPRTIVFPYLTLRRPTFMYEHGSLVCTHPSVFAPDDQIGPQFQQLVDSAPPIRFRLQTGDFVVNHNHRMLHGRTEFADSTRDLLRVHVWFTRPMPAPRALLARARRALDSKPAWATPKNFAIPDPDAAQRLGAVLESLGLVRDHPVLAEFYQRIGADENRLSRWRELALDAALAELERQVRAERPRRR